MLASDPELLREERGTGKAGRKGWDFALVGVSGLLTALVMPLLAGLDRRYGWSPPVDGWSRFAALVVFFTAWGIHIWAMAVNRYFSKAVYI